MALFSIPDPVSILEAAATAKIERETINSLVSASYSAQITFLWRAAQSKLARVLGLSAAMQDAAEAEYLSLRELQERQFLTLTVPNDMLDPNLEARFETVLVKKH